MRTYFLVAAFVLGLTSCTTTSSTASEIEGVVAMVGSAPNARPIVEPNGPKSQLEVCKGKEQDLLRKLGGTIVKASGEWSTDKLTKERCFAISSVKVTQLVKGRPAFIGNLSKDADGIVTLSSEEGKDMVLEHPAKGVIALVGKKVIMDLVPSVAVNEKKEGKTLWKVVTYLEHP